MEERLRPAAAVLAALGGLLLLSAALGAREAGPPAGRWGPLAALIGHWEGGGTGLGGRSETTHSYEPVIADQFLHMRTISRFEPAEGETEGEVHEDWGLFSYDPDREHVVLRQFLSEGYVNTYVLGDPGAGKADGGELVLTSTETEGAGGTRARITIRFSGPDAYTMVLELAPPGQDWFACRNITMRRSAH